MIWQWIRKLSMGGKLMLVHAVSALIVLSVSGGLMLWSNYAQMQHQLDTRIAELTKVTAKNVEAAVVFDDWEQVEEIGKFLLMDAAVQQLTVHDARGNPQVSIQREQAEQKIDALELQLSSANVIVGEEVVGELNVTYSNHIVKAALTNALSEVFLLMLVGMAVGLFVSSRIQRLVTNPIKNITSTIRQVQTDHNYSLRADKKYPDEIGRLTDDLNNMLRTIDERDRHLESQVELRTRELREEHVAKQRAVAERIASQRQFEHAFHHAPFGMALLNSGEHIFQRNATLNEMLSIEPDADLYLCDMLFDEHYETLQDHLTEQRKGNLAAVDYTTQLHLSDGSVKDVVLSLGEVFDEWSHYLYSVLQVQDITEAATLSRKLQYQAGHDDLTGLPNRRSLEHILERATRSGSTATQDGAFCLCMVDLDGFKLVNDTSGHAAGDALLIEIASILRANIRADDAAVRLGGDEFALFLRQCSQQNAREISNKVRTQIRDLVFRWEFEVHRISASVGIATSENCQDMETIMRNADAACYVAKSSGRNRVVLYNDQSKAILSKHSDVNWARRIKDAIEDDHFVLFSQKIQALKPTDALQPQNYEILLRMRDYRTGRLFPPSGFLPAAERFQLQINIDRWVLSKTIAHLLDERTHGGPAIEYWVNISGASLSDEMFIDFVHQQLENAGLPKNAINFEITETAVVQCLDAASEAMQRISALGCRFALDDFGTGMSSFGYLKGLPVDHVKVDGSFVRNINADPIDRKFVETIIDISQTMGKRTVVEFVETDDILFTVKTLGADYAQGYAIDKPSELLGSGYIATQGLSG